MTDYRPFIDSFFAGFISQSLGGQCRLEKKQKEVSRAYFRVKLTCCGRCHSIQKGKKTSFLAQKKKRRNILFSFSSSGCRRLFFILRLWGRRQRMRRFIFMSLGFYAMMSWCFQDGYSASGATGRKHVVIIFQAEYSWKVKEWQVCICVCVCGYTFSVCTLDRSPVHSFLENLNVSTALCAPLLIHFLFGIWLHRCGG